MLPCRHSPLTRARRRSVVLGVEEFGLDPLGEEEFGFEGLEGGWGRRRDEMRDAMSHGLSQCLNSHLSRYLISVEETAEAPY
jgi:hypothetical protein